MIALALAAALQSAPPAGRDYPPGRLAAALAAARAGDTVRVPAGTYHEHLVIERPVVLIGEPGAVLTGDGRGTVLTVRAGATIRGLTIRDSGTDQSREDAGLLAENADHLVVEQNRLANVLFGIYVKQAHGVVIRDNQIEGPPLAPARRGDGIRLWYTRDVLIDGNLVRRTRDVVIWFSRDVVVRENQILEGRYGLHYMYSHHNRFDRNRFEGNEVGAFIMYSGDIQLRQNLFAHARGPSGQGLGFKDADSIVAEHNQLIANAIGLSLDNSPHLEGTTNLFRGNLVAANGVAVSLLPSVKGNVFTGNQFVDNVQLVNVSGGGAALGNQWRGNYWSDYAGFDPDGDGIGNTPFVHDRLSDDLVARYPALRLFQASLAMAALNTMCRVLPLLAPEPIVVDSFPQIGRRRRTW